MRLHLLMHYLLLLVLLAASTGCKQNQELPPEKSVGQIIGFNYTEEGIQDFYVDKAWGADISPFGGGGSVCCLLYPRTWHPGLSVNIKWKRTDGFEADGKTFKLVWREKVVPIPQYQGNGEVYVLFFKDDRVEVHISTKGIANSDFPGNPGYPANPAHSRSKLP